MTIIFQLGERFWIESVELPTIVLVDAAGRIDSAVVNLERSGRVVGFAVTERGGPDNDNSQAVGSFDLRGEAGQGVPYGTFITGVLWRINKHSGTAGNTNATASAILFMRK